MLLYTVKFTRKYLPTCTIRFLTIFWSLRKMSVLRTKVNVN